MRNIQEANPAAIPTITGAPAVVTTVDDDGGWRMSVFGADRVEICGAFKPVDRSYWLMYVTKRIVDAVERSQATLIPRRIQLPTQQDVRQWLELIAGLYMQAADR
ncbi:hypothetical protein [Mycobacterium branderi]|uniref:Uncharacterized protein n=2 Tax=Mycobacterium branderi TaxID=43348 RepID=A0ABM7KFL5_9MYCO|nr:hypothetical protein [Mycobacterium branderi]MCV7232912.1 hypothetical protein [Mycobacterium branderi]BBZ10016.1 hypothetical protein MBRA_02110 [Mycobacterium branderi]